MVVKPHNDIPDFLAAIQLPEEAQEGNKEKKNKKDKKAKKRKRSKKFHRAKGKAEEKKPYTSSYPEKPLSGTPPSPTCKPGWHPPPRRPLDLQPTGMKYSRDPSADIEYTHEIPSPEKDPFTIDPIKDCHHVW